MSALSLRLLAEPLAIARLPPDADVPAWALRGSFVSTIRTAAELSVVAPAAAVPANAKAERGWRALHVDGTLDFGLTGILAALAVPLADAGVSIFALVDLRHGLPPHPRDPVAHGAPCGSARRATPSRRTRRAPGDVNPLDAIRRST